MAKQNSGSKARRLKNGAEALDLSTLPRCKAISETTGKPCKRAALKGQGVCGIHSGRYRPGAPVNNKNAVTKSVYTEELMESIAETRRLISYLQGLIDAAINRHTKFESLKEAS